MHYEYSELKPFIGFASFELEDISLAFAAYEDNCKIQPDAGIGALPFGFDHLVAGGGISLEEATGSSVVQSHTWDNESHGDSVHDVEQPLDGGQINNADDDKVSGDMIEDTNPTPMGTTTIEIGVDVTIDIHTGGSGTPTPTEGESEDTAMASEGADY